MGMMISHDMLLGRWRLSLELFGRVFMEDVGAEPGSVKNYYFFIISIIFCLQHILQYLNGARPCTFLYLMAS